MKEKPNNKEIYEALRKEIIEVQRVNTEQNHELEVKISERMRDLTFQIIAMIVGLHGFAFLADQIFHR
jgi:hypothetical protein